MFTLSIISFFFLAYITCSCYCFHMQCASIMTQPSILFKIILKMYHSFNSFMLQPLKKTFLHFACSFTSLIVCFYFNIKINITVFFLLPITHFSLLTFVSRQSKWKQLSFSFSDAMCQSNSFHSDA